MASIKQIEHKGFVAEVTYSTEDSCYYASLTGKPKLSLLAEGKTVDDLLNAFASLVDDSIKAMSEEGFA